MKRREFILSSAAGSIAFVASPFATGGATSALGALSDGVLRGTARGRSSSRAAISTRRSFATWRNSPASRGAPLFPSDGVGGFARSHHRVVQRLRPLEVTPFVQTSFIESGSQTQGWDEVLLSMDGIVASEETRSISRRSGKRRGSTSCSAGVGPRHRARRSECRFLVLVRRRHDRLTTEGALDRERAGVRHGESPPHYDREPKRRPLYQKLIGSGEMKPGYACDNDAGIYFEDNEVSASSPRVRKPSVIT